VCETVPRHVQPAIELAAADVQPGKQFAAEQFHSFDQVPGLDRCHKGTRVAPNLLPVQSNHFSAITAEGLAPERST
jgi:hypothetical protein